MNYTFNFNVAQVNLILKGLGELPHKESNELVTQIFSSSKTQEAAAAAKTASPTTPQTQPIAAPNTTPTASGPAEAGGTAPTTVEQRAPTPTTAAPAAKP